MKRSGLRGFLLTLVLLTACAGGNRQSADGTSNRAPVTPRTPEAKAAVLEKGTIRRDRETRRAIARSESRRLPARGRTGDLNLRVTKSRYRLDVLRGASVLKTYPVALGFQPSGAKERSGDGKTPEGRYPLIPHHPSPSFGSCFYVCYPNETDVRRGLEKNLVTRDAARRLLVSLKDRGKPHHDTALGGLILLHGTKDRSVSGLTDTNWTLGCIAMENDDVLELLAVYRTSDRTILEILP